MIVNQKAEMARAADAKQPIEEKPESTSAQPPATETMQTGDVVKVNTADIGVDAARW